MKKNSIQKFSFIYSIFQLLKRKFTKYTNTETSESKSVFFIFQRCNMTNITSNQCHQINMRNVDANRYSKINRNAIICIIAIILN